MRLRYNAPMNELKQIDAFREVLAQYHPSEETKKTLADIKLALLVGPSSAGRNTIINHLIKTTGAYHYIVSDTTRKPRVNDGILEQNGREYWFRSEEDILADLRAGNFLEAAIIHNQQVSGISLRELKAAADDHKIAINEIEVVGADNIHAATPSAVFLFVIPPGFDEWMARMNIRGQLPEEEVRRRLESAVFEISTALERDYYTFIVNDTFMHAAHRVDEIIRGNTTDAEDQDAAKAVAKELLEDTKKYLASMKKPELAR